MRRDRDEETFLPMNRKKLESLRKTCNHKKWECKPWTSNGTNRGGGSQRTQCECTKGSATKSQEPSQQKQARRANSPPPEESRGPSTAPPQQQSQLPWENNPGATRARRPSPRDSQPNITVSNHINTKKWGAKVGKSKNRQRLPVPLCHLAPRS